MIKKKYRSNILIGTDPEFILIQDGKIQTANNYGIFNNTTSEIGCDGGRIPLEIRPPPVSITNIKRMVDNIEDILTEISYSCNPDNIRLYAGAHRKAEMRDHYSNEVHSSHVPIGCHLHFGRSNLLYMQQYDKKKFYNLDYYINQDKLVWLLDTLFLPIINFFISPKELYERTRRNYGKLGDVRNQPWGFEYRTPYSFIISPFLTKAFFSLVSLIAYNYKRIPLKMDIHQDVVKYYENVREIKKLKGIYKQIKPIIIRLIKYNSPNPEFDSYIISLFSLIENRKECYMDMDVLKNYNLLQKRQPKNMFFSRNMDIEKIRYVLEKNVFNKKFPKIYIYMVDKETRNMRWEYHKYLKGDYIFLQNIPSMVVPTGIKTVRYTLNQSKNYTKAMGLTPKLVNNINNGKYNIGFLIKYLNKLSKYG